ncbi:HNH endonuclease [Pseudonocardiaceae bacterium YIM PH 21723]|nr:HNH endonuclease [Pseudonocardiaceae bacterium YIM PH 21723]
MVRRPCLGCGRLTSNRSRCDACQQQWDRVQDSGRGSATQRGYGAQYQRVARQLIAEHRQAHGAWCPGWARPPHQDEDLTADHIVPLSKDGTHQRSNLQVLCRTCNAAKGNR